MRMVYESRRMDRIRFREKNSINFVYACVCVAVELCIKTKVNFDSVCGGDWM
jgi:hypothetical protein